MTIKFKCDYCKKFLKTSDDKAGGSAKCPSCGEWIVVPSLVPSLVSDDFDDYEDYDAARQRLIQAGVDQSDDYEDYDAPPRRRPTVTDMKESCPGCGEQIKGSATKCLYCGHELDASSDRRRQDYAGFWMRLVAWLIDSLVLGIPMGCLFWIAVVASTGEPPDAAAIQFGSQILKLLIGWLYFALLESSPKQATLGKMALGITVTDYSGRRISFGRATGRYFGKIVSGFCLIGYIMAGLTEKKQALHDILSGCLVVRGPVI